QHPRDGVRREGGAVSEVVTEQTVLADDLQTAGPLHVSPRPDPLAVVVDATRRLGEQTAFYGQALAATPDAVRRYPGEVLRLIATMGLGTGALAVIGGTVVIVGFLTLSTGALIAVQGYNTLS